MVLTIDYSFYNRDLRISLFNAINSITVIKSIKYSVNFEWFDLHDINQLNLVKFEQVNIETELFDVVSLQLFENNLPRVFVTNASMEAKDKFVRLIESNFLNDICYGKVCESIDNTLQNVETPDSWRRKKRQLPDYIELFPNPIYTNEREKELLSIESLPGHSHHMSYDERLWFGSCWQMYFSSTYYKYIPKFLFDDFQDYFEHKVFENGLRKITLYEKPEDFDLPENRAKQWDFRRALGIDSIAHELTKQSNRIEPENLPVKITKQNCIKGTTRVELINGSEIKVMEYLDDGVTLVFEETKPARAHLA